MRARATLGWTAVLLGLAGLAAVSASAQDAIRPRLVEAVAAYTAAQDEVARDQRVAGFRRAARLFQAAADQAGGVDGGGVAAALYTNAGNAALQAEDLGGAVLAYRRALLLDPDSRQASQNLDHARSLLPAWVPRPEPEGLLDSFFFWHRVVPRPTRVLLGAAAFALTALLLAGAIRLRLPALRTTAILPGLVWLALVASVLLDPAEQARDDAVVTVAEVLARASDSRLAPAAFPEPLPGGVELRILERRSPWLRVRLASGRDAWVSESSVSPVWGRAAGG